MVSKFIKLLHKLDYFDIPIQLKFNNEDTVSTIIGSILSLCIYILSLALTISYGSSIYNRTTPTVTQINSYNVTAPIINMKDMDLTLIATMVDANGVIFNDPSYFSLSLTQYLLNRYENGTYTVASLDLKITNCTRFINIFEKHNLLNDFLSNNLSEGICFDFLETGLQIGGTYTSNYLSSINYKVQTCVNSTNSKVVCKPKDEIQQKLLQATFSIYYIDHYIDSDNYLSPFVSYLGQYFIKTDTNLYKYSNIYFQYSTVLTNNGLIFDGNIVDSSLILQDYKEQYYISTSSRFLNIYVNISNNILNVSRVYTKLSDLAATVGGIFSFLTFFGAIITNFFAKYQIYEDLINSLFFINSNHLTKRLSKSLFENKLNFKDAKYNGINNCKDDLILKNKASSKKSNIFQDINNSNNDKSSKRFSFDKVSINNFMNINTNRLKSNKGSKTNNLIKDKFNSVESFKYFYKRKTREKNELYDLGKNNIIYKLNYFDVLGIFFCSKSNKYKKKLKIFETASKKLSKYLDFLDIVRTLQEFRKLKKIIFNEEQRELFLYTKRPIVGIQERNSVKSEFVHNLGECYQRLKLKENKSEVDERILSRLDSNLKMILEFEAVKNKDNNGNNDSKNNKN